MKRFLAAIAVAWCNMMHHQVSRPLGTYYICWHCQRRIPVPYLPPARPALYPDRLRSASVEQCS